MFHPLTFSLRFFPETARLICKTKDSETVFFFVLLFRLSKSIPRVKSLLFVPWRFPGSSIIPDENPDRPATPELIKNPPESRIAIIKLPGKLDQRWLVRKSPIRQNLPDLFPVHYYDCRCPSIPIHYPDPNVPGSRLHWTSLHCATFVMPLNNPCMENSAASEYPIFPAPERTYVRKTRFGYFIAWIFTIRIYVRVFR